VQINVQTVLSFLAMLKEAYSGQAAAVHKLSAKWRSVLFAVVICVIDTLSNTLALRCCQVGPIWVRSASDERFIEIFSLPHRSIQK